MSAWVWLPLILVAAFVVSMVFLVRDRMRQLGLSSDDDEAPILDEDERKRMEIRARARRAKRAGDHHRNRTP